MVYKPDDKVYFHEHENRLYFHDLGLRKDSEKAIMLPIETMAENKTKFTKREVRDAEHSCCVYSMIRRPSMKDYKKIIQHNLIHNCPVTIEHVEAADRIFGLDVASLKEKTTRPPSPIVRTNVIAVTPVIRKYHNNVELVADMMFVNEIPILVTLSRKNIFGTSQFMHRRTGVNLLKGIKK